jgi:hypothetical protein
MRRGRLGPVGVAIATRLTVASGRPRDVLGDSLDGVVYLLPRGEAGTNPLVTQANVRLAATWHGVDITLDLFNVFDRRTATSTDDIYASGAVHPIDQGTLADLVFLRSETGTIPTRRSAYETPTGYQAPLSAVLGIHRAFE